HHLCVTDLYGPQFLVQRRHSSIGWINDHRRLWRHSFRSVGFEPELVVPVTGNGRALLIHATDLLEICPGEPLCQGRPFGLLGGGNLVRRRRCSPCPLRRSFKRNYTLVPPDALQVGLAPHGSRGRPRRRRPALPHRGSDTNSRFRPERRNCNERAYDTQRNEKSASHCLRTPRPSPSARIVAFLLSFY